MTFRRVGIAVTLCASYLLAQPSGHEIAHGSADVQALQNLLQITTSDKAIINWQEFSSKAGETIRFVQPSASSAVLNRVTGGNTSTLYGNLEASGQVYLVNPNGIVIGEHARIDAGAFTASTFDVLDSDFIDGSALRFFGDSKAGVVNLGTIKTSAGDCSLISFQVENDGTIEAAGKASLVASNKVILKPHDSQRIFIAADADIAPGDILDNPYLLAFNQTIEKDALHFKKDDTGIFLMIDEPVATVAGSIKAESATVLGNFVQVLDGASIDVSSENGGGEILIGGDYQGKNDSIVNARAAFVGRHASLCADALDAGEGGKVIIWGDDLNSFHGDISAKPQGFVEISSHGFLSPDGIVDTGGGTLLLDPVDVTIAAANVNITFPLAAPCTGIPNPINYAYTQPATISAASLAGYLACNDVIIATNQAGAGTGNISVTSSVSWASAFELTLDTTGTSGGITCMANIQNTGTGGVTLNSGTGTVNIGTAGMLVKASVGSQNGPTVINAPNAIVNVQGGNLGPSLPAQVGFYAPTGSTSTGPITVTCSQLNMTGGNTFSVAQVGHGEPDTTANSTTTSAAAINVTSGGNITMTATSSAAGTQTGAVIGHGSLRWDVANAASADQAGAITVITNAGSLSMTTGAGAIVNDFVRIGHSWLAEVAGAVVTRPAITGNISVQVPAGNISMTASNPNGNNVWIGHGKNTVPGFQMRSINADIDIFCSGDLLMDGSATPTSICSIWIGSSSFSGVAPEIDTFAQHLRVTAGNDILMHPSFRMFIGSLVVSPSISYQSDTTVVAGRDLIMNGPHGSIEIGVTQNGTDPAINTGATSVAAGRNILIDRTPGTVNCIGRISAPGDVNVAAGGDITVTAGPSAASIGTTNRVTGGNATSTIYACGSILSSNSATTVASVGYDAASIIVTTPYTVDIKADGDVQISDGFSGGNTTTAGNLTIEADANLAAGALWSYTGTNLTSIASHALNPLFPINHTSFLPAPINATSSACPADGFGGVRIVATPLIPTNNITFSTTSGNITIHSACKQVNGTLQDLNVGTVGPASTLNIVTTSGNIEIAGSIPSDSFNDLTLTSVANPWTSGTIYASACNDLNENTQVHTTGAGKFITLIADADDSGAGNLTLTQNVTTNNGPILLDAGFGAGGGSSAINQTAGQISSTGGAITAQAVGNITFNGAATSVTSLAGNISATSTAGSVTADQDVVSTAGNISMNAGVDVNVLATANVTSSAGGSITMNAGNDITINGDPTSVSTTTGFIDMTAGSDIFIDQIVQSTSGNISSLAGDNTTLSTAIGTPLVTTAGTILMITGNDFSLLGTSNITSSAGPVTLVADNDFPSAPGIGTGAFFLAPTAQVNSGPGQKLQVFTALQGLNNIAGLLNGASFTAGTIFIDTSSEQWCTYYPSLFGGSPFTIFYKNCEQIIIQTGNKVVSDMLFNLNVENMWVEELLSPLIPPEVWRFMIIYDKGVNALTHFAHERYWLSRRNIHFIHYPYVYKENKPLAELVAPALAAKAPKRKKRLF